jgi:hypothetical protein
MPSAWLRRNVFHPCEGGPLLRATYLATLVWPICCLGTTTSASSVARDRRRPITIPKISLHKSNIERQLRPILDQPPAD